MKYTYPAVFTKECGLYSVNFPDLKGCYTCGDSIDDACKMAEDILAIVLYHAEIENRSVSAPSDPDQMPVPSDSFVKLITCDTETYYRYFADASKKV